MHYLRTEKIHTLIRDMGFEVVRKGERGPIAIVSAENGDNAADYYGEFRGGYPWINPQLEELAEKYDCFWEWENPGAIALYEI